MDQRLGRFNHLANMATMRNANIQTTAIVSEIIIILSITLVAISETLEDINLFAHFLSYLYLSIVAFGFSLIRFRKIKLLLFPVNKGRFTYLLAKGMPETNPNRLFSNI